ncbi:Gfo/Idh/MocA family protein [Reinekea sp.]|jgi:predicted dehydrogenase|uniref:Gfo/Idh/MocA family protein n=1 Tax=Reinekea sp. TaxID=1970455 RepID=UPI003988BA7A
MIVWGVAGTGAMATLFLEDTKAIESGEFKAVFSSNSDRAQAFAQKHDLGFAYSDYQELLANPDIDAIYIAGVHTTHDQMAIAALNAGKHVLVEKPLSLSVTQTEAVIAAAKANNRFCAEALWTRFSPTFSAVVDQVKSGKIGEVRHISANFGFRVNVDDHQQRLLNPQLAGGAMFDIGIYPLLLPTFVLGEPEHIHANVVMADTGVDLASDVLLSYPHGVSASLTYRLDTHLPTKAVISGTQGYVEFESPWFAANAVHWSIAGQPIETEYFTLTNRGWGYEFDEVNRCIKAGLVESPKHTWADALMLAKLMERIRSEYGPIYPFE